MEIKEGGSKLNLMSFEKKSGKGMDFVADQEHKDEIL